MSGFKLPSDPSDAPSYALWRKDAEIWQKLTDVAKAKQGLALQYACRSNERIHESVTNIDSEKVECDDGFKNVMEVLDGLFKTDDKDAEMKAYHDLETIQRGEEQTVADYLNHFDAVLNKTKKHGNIMSDNLLAVKLMRGANLTKSQMEIIKASTAKIDYTTVKATMKRMFGESTGISTYRNTETPFIKTEPTFQTSKNEEMGACKGGHQSGKLDEDEEVLYGGYRSQDKYRGKNFNKSMVPGNNRNNSLRGRNPLDPQGNITRCNICDSVNHWATKCPDRDLPRSKGGDVLYNIVLFQSDLENTENISSLAFETMGAAVADCGASKTVCGLDWLNSYIDLLSAEDRELVSYQSTSSSYKFGVGEPHKAFTSVKIPVVIGSQKVFLEADVITYDLPLLLSKATMKRAKAHLNTEDDEITMLGETIKLINTSTGHYAIPLCAKRSFINTFTELPSRNLQDKVVFLSADPAISRHEVAVKLHRQFCHPPAEKLIRLVNRSDLKEDVDLKKEIKEVTDNCITCKRFKKPPPRPVVGLPVSSRFNELIAMDIKFYHGTPILHLIDTCTRFSAAGALTSKASKQVIECIFSHWITIFGRPAKIISDNGGEFASAEFRSMAESMGIYVSTTAAESPWSNGLCERYNQVLGEMIDKVKSEVDCSLPVAIAWSVSAKNSLQNVHGFSPAQLVFGFNPMLPSILCDKPPALSSDGYSDIIARNLNAQKMAREAFTQAESSERIRRALNHNIRSSNDIKYVNGDKVLYKRKDDRCWHGPGSVIGQDGQFVLIRNQSTWIRVHPCRMQLLEESSDYQGEYETVPYSDKKPEAPKVDSSDEEYDGSESTPQTANTIDVVTGDKTANTIDDVTGDKDEPNEENLNQGDIPYEEKENYKPEVSNQEINDTTTEQTTEDIITNSRVTCKAGKNPYNKAKKFKNTLKPGVTVRFRLKDSSEWISGEIIRRSATVRGKYPNEWNINIDGEIKQVDFDRNVDDVEEVLAASGTIWEYKEVDIANEIHTSQVFAVEISDQVKEAKAKELDVWKSKNVYEEVVNDNYDLMSLKWVVKPKLIDGVHSLKARLVARGYEETSEFRRDSPTCSKPSIRMVLIITATQKHKICSLDVKSAFLNNDHINREIYVKPPKEAATKNVWRLKKTVYGLRDASRAWYLRLQQELSALGCLMSSIDPAVFFWRNQGNLEGILAIYVDDVLYSGTIAFIEIVMNKITDLFTIGSQNDQTFIYIGIELLQNADWSITMSQKSYTDSLQPIPIPVSNMPLDSPIPEDMKTPMRSLIGQLNWASSISRPDIAYQTCEISTRINKATVKDVHKLNKVVRYMKNNPVAIHIPSFTRLEDLDLEVYVDAAFGNLSEGSSQGAYIIFVSDGVNRTPVTWSSHKIRRVARSTLTAETLAMADAVDVALHFATLISEVIYNGKKMVGITCFTDCDSLFQAAQTTNVVGEKRLLIELSAIRQGMDRGEFKLKWVQSKDQLADSLTKAGASTALLRQVLQNGTAKV